MSALDDERAYTLWTARKSTKLRRPTLDCGHPNLGEVSIHLWCDYLPCPSCADVVHDCSAYGGAKNKDGTEKGPETVEAAAPVPAVQSDTSPRVSLAGVAAGPSAGGDPATVDLRRRVQDGTAPGPDRVGAAFRAEVLRQGLTDCEIDGVRWIYGGGQWSESPYQPPSVEPFRLVRRTPEEHIAYLSQQVAAAVTAGRTPEFVDALRQVHALACLERLDGLSPECGMGNPLCSGCDGQARGNNGPCRHDCHPRGWWVGRVGRERVDELWREIDAEPEPVLPLVDEHRCDNCDGIDPASCMANRGPIVDAALEPSPDVTLMPAAQFDNLVATLDEPDDVPALRRAFWRRWFR